MALAIASGVPPERGLYTAIVAGFLVSLLGGTYNCIGGPTGAFVVIVAGIVHRHGYDGLVLATFLAGGMLILMGAAGMGRLIKYIPFPVTTGFTSGIAVVILSTQVVDLFGLKTEPIPAEFLEKVPVILAALPTTGIAAATLGLGTIATILLLRRISPRAPAALVAVVGGALLARFLDLPVETIESRFGGIPAGLPSFSLPAVSVARLRELLPDAFTIALLGAVESLLCAVVADGMAGTRHRSDTELIGQGVANIASAFLGGIPATSAIARTTANIRSGARTPVAGMIHSVALLGILVAAAPLASAIPLASLAGILVVVALDMSEFHRYRRLIRAPRSDVMVLVLTFGLTVIVDLTVAVQVGVVLSAILFMRRMSEVTSVERIVADRSDEEQGAPGGDATAIILPSGVELYRINGPFFFGVADRFVSSFTRDAGELKAIIIDLAPVPALDATGLHALEDLHDHCRRREIRLLLIGTHAQPFTAIRKSGFDETIGEENLCGDLADALACLESPRPSAG
jgi:SulP family sulfate permease